MKIRIITTGGTIGGKGGRKSPDEIEGAIFLLEGLASEYDAIVEELFSKNSRDLQAADLELIFCRCLKSRQRAIAVTHGTHTMCDTARYLGERRAALADKTVILTGALKPVSEPGSDAKFNLGYALSVAGDLPPGVYVAMHGRIFDWHNVKKDERLKCFTALE